MASASGLPGRDEIGGATLSGAPTEHPLPGLSGLDRIGGEPGSRRQPAAPAARPLPRLPGPDRVGGRFHTAAAALVFAGQVGDLGRAESLRIAHSPSAGVWWAVADIPLGVGRELASATRGTPVRETGGRLVADRAWGPPLNGATAVADTPADLREVELRALVRIAGLHRSPGREQSEVTVLLPGFQLATLVRRALDLDLDVAYRVVALSPLFEPSGQPDTRFEVVLRSRSGALPPAFVAALRRDPFVLACRRVGDHLLVQDHLASPLPDRHLAGLAERDTPGAWVLAEATFGCHVLRAEDGEYHDGVGLVRLADGYELSGPAPGWTAGDTVPEQPELSLVPATTPGAAVDAVLLDDADLACLPELLAGRPLAESALLARGRDHHLVLVPGGLLDRLAVGEPLYRIGPGPLYLPLGRRLRPALPPQARQHLFAADERNAVVLVDSDRALAFDLTACQPIWTLWVGQRPPIDRQLPPEVVALLDETEARDHAAPNGTQSPTGRAGTPSPTGDRAQRPTSPRYPTITPTGLRDSADRAAQARIDWRAQAWRAERSGDLVRAAEIHERNNDYRRAAHLYELAAREASRHRPSGRGES